jgi:hypothetical protein
MKLYRALRSCAYCLQMIIESNWSTSIFKLRSPFTKKSAFKDTLICRLVRRKSAIKLEIASWTDLFRKHCWRRTNVGVGIMFFQQFVGINAVRILIPVDMCISLTVEKS